MLGISLLDTGITFIEKVVSTSQPATKTMKRDISGHRFLRIGSMYIYIYIGYLRAKRMCCPRPLGNIQWEAKKRGRREHFGHWGS